MPDRYATVNLCSRMLHSYVRWDLDSGPENLLNHDFSVNKLPFFGSVEFLQMSTRTTV